MQYSQKLMPEPANLSPKLVRGINVVRLTENTPNPASNHCFDANQVPYGVESVSLKRSLPRIPAITGYIQAPRGYLYPGAQADSMRPFPPGVQNTCCRLDKILFAYSVCRKRKGIVCLQHIKEKRIKQVSILPIPAAQIGIRRNQIVGSPAGDKIMVHLGTVLIVEEGTVCGNVTVKSRSVGSNQDAVALVGQYKGKIFRVSFLRNIAGASSEV